MGTKDVILQHGAAYTLTPDVPYLQRHIRTIYTRDGDRDGDGNGNGDGHGDGDRDGDGDGDGCRYAVV